MEDENETNEPVTKRHRAMQIIYYLLWICGGSYVGELQELDTLGKSLKTIGKRAFYGCNKLKEVVIPDSVTSIGSAAIVW